MADSERLDQRAMIAEDQRNLERALEAARKRKAKSAGDRQIAEELEKMAGVQDLDDPQRYHGS
jgi:hypothetical protein